MRNLKKFLALVLAMMMVFSLMVTVNAASTTDYSGAYAKLESYGVFQGMTGGKANLSEPFTRAQMAAVAYRIATGDVGDEQIDLYVGYSARFTDVAEDAWYAGYIGFCANYGIVVGYGNGKFGPNDQVTGVQAAAMLLRLLGWGQDHEYEGKNWDYRVAGQAERVGMLRGITSDDLFDRANRGLAAQIAYNAVTYPWQVTYANNTYVQNGPHLITATDSAPVYSTDDWGAPSKTTTTTVTFNWNYWGPVTKVLPATTDNGLVYRFYGPMTECDVADEIGGSAELTAYTNGYGNDSVVYIDELNTTGFIGAQGRETSIYDVNGDGDPDVLVYKDIVLAEVGNMTGSIVDTGAHQMAGATLWSTTVYANSVIEGVDPNQSLTLGGTYTYVTNSARTYNIAGDFTPGQFVYAYILTGTDTNQINSGSTPVNPATGANYAASRWRLEYIGTPSEAQVTVNGIIYDGGANGVGSIVGFEDTNGTEYLYDSSFGYNAADPNCAPGNPVKVLNNSDIKKEFTVYYWTDRNGDHNVLGIAPARYAEQYGVVIGQKAVVVSNPNSLANSYAIEYTILMGNNTITGTTGTFNVVPDSGVPYSATDVSDGTAVDLMRKLVKIEVNPGNSNYYKLTPALDDLVTTDGQVVYARDADTLDPTYTYNTPVLVDNNTTFFVANYTMNNASDVQGAYTPTGYSVYYGFQDAALNFDMTYSGLTNGIYENGTSLRGYDGSDAYNQNITNLDVYAFAADGTVLDNNGDDTAAYVLVLNATEKTPITERQQVVPTYAYVVSALNQSTVYDDYYKFNVLRNGTAGTLNLNNAAGQIVTTNGSGLYIYRASSTNSPDGPYNAIVGNNRVNHVYSTTSATSWTYEAGVLTVTASTVPGTMGTNNAGTPELVNTNGYDTGKLPTGWNNKFLTVRGDVKIFIVNESTGKAYPTDYSLSTLATWYDELYYEVDGYGCISYIYVVDKDNGFGPGTPATTYGVSLTLTIVAPSTGTTVATRTITVNRANGTYTFTLSDVAALCGYSTTGLQAIGPASVTVTVNGAAASASLTAYYTS